MLERRELQPQLPFDSKHDFGVSNQAELTQRRREIEALSRSQNIKYHRFSGPSD